MPKRLVGYDYDTSEKGEQEGHVVVELPPPDPDLHRICEPVTFIVPNEWVEVEVRGSGPHRPGHRRVTIPMEVLRAIVADDLIHHLEARRSESSPLSILGYRR